MFRRCAAFTRQNQCSALALAWNERAEKCGHNFDALSISEALAYPVILVDQTTGVRPIRWLPDVKMNELQILCSFPALTCLDITMSKRVLEQFESLASNSLPN